MTSPGTVHSLNARRASKHLRGDRAHGRPASVKFPEIDYICVEALSWWERVKVTDTVRIAMDEYFIRRYKDPTLAKQIDDAKARHAAMLSAATMKGSAKDLVIPGDDVEADDASNPTPATKEQGRPLTIRLTIHYINKLTAFALIDDNTMADQMRRAVDEHIERHIAGDREDAARIFQTKQADLGNFIIPSKKSALAQTSTRVAH